jgi:hypothetical protein
MMCSFVVEKQSRLRDREQLSVAVQTGYGDVMGFVLSGQLA